MTVKHWGENPVGTWTIRVSDQGASSNFNGSFLGWNMVFWGSAVDPTKTTLFEVPLDEVDVVLPPHESPPPPPPSSSMASPTSTERGRPTAHLPGDHGEAPGENTNATFPGSEDAAVSPFPSPSPSGTSTPTADEGWFSDMSNLVKSQAWFFGAVGAVAVFGLGLGVYFWRRRVQARRLRDYSSLPEGDELPMSGVRGGRLAGGGGPRTKELYDAFGEVSDGEEEDADEQTRLRSGYEDEHRAGGSRGQYRDEPEGAPLGGAASPDKGSDGSWEHASS
jgi:kexin